MRLISASGCGCPHLALYTVLRYGVDDHSEYRCLKEIIAAGALIAGIIQSILK